MPKGQPRKLYLIGIKGVAMAGLAVMAKELGYDVTGSDTGEVFITDEQLRQNGIEFFEGFSATNIKNSHPDLVVIGAAFGANNVEVKATKSLRLKTLTLSEMLGKIMTDYEVIGVTGVHGKTTVTSMLTLIMQEAGFSPSYVIGTSEIPGLDKSAHIGEGQHFVVEADEYKKSETNLQPKFLDYPIKHLIVTSIELDHPDVFPSAEHMYQAFYQLSLRLPRRGVVVANSDWPLVRRLVSRMADRKCYSYGFEPFARYQITELTEGARTSFCLKSKSEKLGPVELSMPGKHNVLNAAAALLMAKALGVTEESAVKTLKKFTGPKRRFERLGEYNGAVFYDDYAHHPTALRFLIDAARKKFPTKKITLVFQPHTYSRTDKLLKELAESLIGVDRLIILNIWASAREKAGFVTIKDLLNEIRKHKSDVEFRSSLEDVAAYLAGTVTARDLVLLVGAGDVYKAFNFLPGKSDG